MSPIAGNGVYIDDGEYVFKPRSVQDFAARIAGDRPRPLTDRPPLSIFDPSDMREVGWGLVTPDGVDPAILDALGPLLDLRRRQAPDRFRSDLVYYPGSTANRFLRDHGSGPGPPDPRKVPYYLLLVGGPEDIPFEFQYVLDMQYAVGRLSFETPQEYRNYALGVVACEHGAVRRPRRIDLFGVQNRDDPNTAQAETFLLNPLRVSLDDRKDWHVETWGQRQSTKNSLATLFAGRTAFLFTLSHGMVYRAGGPSQASEEGALLCDDWPGPETWTGRVPRAHYFAADDVRDDVDHRGLICCLCACNSAGTPRLDSFSRALAPDIESRAPHDFVSALPARLLGHQKPALAVIGHVDSLWPVSFQWPGVGSQIGHFEALIKALMAGRPIGLAMEDLGQRHAGIATWITDELERQREDRIDGEDPLSEEEGLVYLWTAHNDARSYVLLGDPAVRMATPLDT